MASINAIMTLMRRAAFALMLVFAQAVAANAAKVVKVSELEAILTEAHAQQQSDSDITLQISSLELSERLTDATLTRLESLLPPDSQAMAALELLADQSIFFQPSAAELIDAPEPDNNALRKIYLATADYLNRYLATTPNLLATRTTTAYISGGYPGKKGVWIEHPGMNKVSTTSLEITTRNDHVQLDPKSRKSQDRDQSIQSWGEFGALPATILSDSNLGGQIFWNYWEPSPTGRLAVVGFQVPQSASHYAFEQDHRILFPAYHGLLWVDSTSGVISKVFVEVEPSILFSYQRFGTMVHYGSMKIDDKQWMGPTRSVAIQKTGGITSGSGQGVWMNEVTFTNYHRFGSNIQIFSSSGNPLPSSPR